MPVYLTHDNRARPFEVRVGMKTVTVALASERHPAETAREEELWKKTFTPSETFVGRSDLNNMTSFSGGHGAYFDGNSFLLGIGELEYVFIGHEIFSFKALDGIVEYHSPVGNNDVPYPWAVDRAGNIYLLLEKIVLTPSEEKTAACKAPQDPYDWYYAANKIPSSVFEFYLGEETTIYNFTYYTDPEKNYDRFLAREEWGSVWVKYPGEEKRALGKEEYCMLIHDLGKEKGFMPLQGVEEIRKRPGW